MISSKDILKTYLDLYQNKHGHKLTPNVSLVPEGDSTLLFVNSGMFPLVPYLSGEPHPLGKRLVNVQRSLRFEDIEEVGVTNRHTTCFHMIGNWSLGDYFKKEQLPWIFEFYIEGIKLDPERLFATVFAGDQYAPKDNESIAILKEIFKKHGIDAKENERIFACDRADNWWQRGDAPGELGGPDSEVFYYLGEGTGVGKHPADHQDEFLEIGNSVFMQYRKTQEGGWEELPQKNVDYGGGLERFALVAQKKQDIYETDNFWPIIEHIQKLSGKKYRENVETTFAMRVVADHVRAATLLAMDGVFPSNKDQGYALRRYLRRMTRFGKKLGLEHISIHLVDTVASMLSWLYPELPKQSAQITAVFKEEEEKFTKTLLRAQKQVHTALLEFSGSDINGLAKLGFDLYQSTGYPPELFLEEAKDKGKNVSLNKFMEAYKQMFEKHQEASRVGAEKKFKGGLADHSEEVVRYHTATHLLHQALRTVLGTHVEQQGSNITGERLRFDFSHSDKLSDEQIKKVETLINDTIKKMLPVNFVMLPREEAEASGALHFFKEKYSDTVKVYYIGDSIETAFSKEFCGGPHVKNLSEMSPTLTIFKQEAVGKGVRRVYVKFS